MKSLKVFIRAGNQPGNLGDVMLIRGLVEFFQSKEARIYVDTVGHSSEDLSEFGLTPENINFSQSNQPNPGSLLGLLNMLLTKRYDIISHYPGMAGFPSESSHFRKRLPLIIIYGLLKLRGYCILYPNCSWNIKKLTNKGIFIEKLFARCCHLYGVRDKKVSQFFNEHGFTKALYVPDIFFQNKHLQTKSQDSGNQRKKILISLRGTIPEISSLDDKKKYENKLFHSINTLVSGLSKKYDITLSYQCIKDSDFMKQLHQKCAGLANVQFIDECLSVRKAYEIYKDHDMIISNRLHCVLFAYICGTRGIALTDNVVHTKLVSSLQTYHTDMYSLDIHGDTELNLSKIGDWIQDPAITNTFSSIATTAKIQTQMILSDITDDFWQS